MHQYLYMLYVCILRTMRYYHREISRCCMYGTDKCVTFHDIYASASRSIATTLLETYVDDPAFY